MTDQILVDSVTINEEDFAFFSKVSPHWWDLGGCMNSLHFAGAVTYKYIRETLASNDVEEAASVNIVDVGCGGGILSEAMAKHGYTVVGIDVNHNVIRIAKEHADKSLTNLTYHLETVERFTSQNPEKYDVVIFSYVLQHVKHHEILVSNCVKLLKPGGVIFITGLAKTFRSWVTVKLILERITRVFPINGHHWKNFNNCDKVEDILKRNGCKVMHRSGVGYDLLKAEWCLCENLDVFYIIRATKHLE